jgi:hypothetical protein
MPSGTQGYEITSGSITESLINRFRNRKDKDEKKSGSGKGGPLAPTGGGGGGAVPASVSVVTPNQKLLVSGQANLLSAGSSAIVPTDGGAITKYDDKLVAVNVQVLEENKKQTKLITAQSQLLALIPGKMGGALAKFSKQESELEETEDLSGTQDYARAKRPKWLDFLLGLLNGVISAVKALAPIIMKAAAMVAAAMAARKLAGALADALRVVPVRVREMPKAALPPAAAVRGALPPARSSQLALPPASVTPQSSALARTTPAPVSGQRALPPGQGQAFNPEVKAQTRALEPLEIGRVDTSKVDPRALRVDGSGESSVDRLLKQARDQSLGREAQEQAVAALRRKKVDLDVKPVTPAIPKPKAPDIPTKGISNAAGAMSDASKMVDKAGAGKYLVPGASAISAGLSIMAGDYAGAIVDSADAAGDALMLGGATGIKATIGTALSSAAAVIGAGITSSYIGEMTRGVGDWVRGDGNNMALNLVSSIVEGLSAALETIGAPFRAIFEFINSGFNMEKSNEVMADIDSNIRESARQGLNAIDFLNIIPDEKGSFGTLGLYGDAAKKADAKMRGEGEVKNASGGSYFLDNPSNFGPFQGGEAGGELVSFTPFGGRQLVNEMGAHMKTALEQPFKFAIGGIAVAISEVIKILGPIGQLMGPVLRPVLDKLLKISGISNLQLSGISGGALGQLGGMLNSPGGPMNNLFQGMSGTFQRMMRSLGMTNVPGVTPGSQPYTGQTSESDFSAVLPQGRPQFNSGFGKRDLGYGSKDHRGIDIGVDRGSPVTSMEKGTVSHIIPDFMHGSAVVVTSDDGNATLYGHVDPTVAQGDEVNKGDKIATVKYWPGTGAMASDNTHLHLERHPGGYQGRGSAVDPLQFTKGKSKVKNAELKAAQNNAANVAPPNNTTGSVMLPRIQAAAKENPELAALAKVMEFNQATQQRAAQPQQQQSGGLGANPFVMPLTDPNAANLAPLTLFKLSQ